MMKLLFTLMMGWLLLTIQGCHSLKKRETIEARHTLFVSLVKTGKNFAIKEISDSKGDVNLKTLQVTSDNVLVRLCGDKEDIRCLDTVLDTVQTGIQRKALLSTYNLLMQNNSEHKKALEEVYARYKENYDSDSKKIKLQYLVNDESKLYKGEPLPFTELLYVGLNDLNYPEKALHKKEIENFFPHDTADFQMDLLRLNERLKVSYKKDLNIYKRTIKKRSTYYPLVRRTSMKEDLFSLRVQAPQNIDRRYVGTKRIIILVLAKDMYDIYPYSFSGENTDLKVSFNKRNTSFINLTKKDIFLESITFLYNGYNQTTMLGRDFSFSELGAGQTTSTPSEIFFTKRFKQAAFFPELSKAKAQARKVNFGIEVKYKVDGSSHSKVFSASKKEVLWRFITGW